jgi:NADPH-dependent 2,4-dienoyl-CoA reductase/sulfur reductase-like enzyme
MPSYTGEMAREMTGGEIEEVMDSFAEAARRAKVAGFDGVELHGTHGYLMAQFFSPYTNRRSDAYGKDRGLFAVQTLERVRAKVGPDYLIGYRMSGEEFVEGGVTLAETRPFARRLEEKGIDYLHVSAGTIEVGHKFVTTMYTPKGSLLPLAEAIKKGAKVPIIAVGAIHDPLLAEEALRDNKADLIAMGRGLLADPDLPNKVQAGKVEEIRTCLRCNEGCSSRTRINRSQRCAVNAEVGRERTMRIQPAPRPKRVCVIGGGPAGMEAARVLAMRGHRVTLFEKEKELGGLLRYAAVPDFKGELRSFLAYLKNQVQKAGAELLLGREATLETVRSLKPDSVVLAAGSTMAVPEIPGTGRSSVGGALELLSGKFNPGERVVIAGGAAMGCEIAVHLAARGKKVTVVEMMGDLALDLEPRSRVALFELMKEGKVETLTGWKLDRIESGGVFLSGKDAAQRDIPADSVVLAIGMVPNREWVRPIQESFPEVFVIGDCLEPRKIYQAIHEGAFAGRVI